MAKQAVVKPDTYLEYLNCRVKRTVNVVDTLHLK
jgi:hypothetical protein